MVVIVSGKVEQAAAIDQNIGGIYCLQVASQTHRAATVNCKIAGHGCESRGFV